VRFAIEKAFYKIDYVLAENDQNRARGSQVKNRVEQKTVFGQTEQMLSDYEVARGRDWKKLGQTLYNAKRYCMQYVHVLKPSGIFAVMANAMTWIME
jgi:hypothetical protein